MVQRELITARAERYFLHFTRRRTVVGLSEAIRSENDGTTVTIAGRSAGVLGDIFDALAR